MSRDGGDQRHVPARVLQIVGIERLVPDAAHPVEGEEDRVGQRKVVLTAVRGIFDRDRAGRAVGLLIDLVGAEAHRIVHADLPGLALTAVRQLDADLAGKIETPARVLDGKAIDVDLGPVRHHDRFARQTGLIGHLGQIERRRADDHRQQDGQVRQKTAVAAEAVFRKDLALADLLALAAHRGKMVAQLPHALRCKAHRIRQLRRALALGPARRDDGFDAHDRAQDQIQTQHHEDHDEIPAGKDVVEPQLENRRVGALIVLHIPHRLVLLRNDGADDRTDGDEHEQQDAEAHGAQKRQDFFHEQHFLLLKTAARPNGRAAESDLNSVGFSAGGTEEVDGLVGQRFGLVKEIVRQLRVVGALAVFHKHKVPIELGVAGKGTNLVELGLADLAAFDRGGQLLGQELELIADGVSTRLDALLGLTDLGDEIDVALGALVLDQLGVVERADEVMAAVGHAVVLGRGRHMAVGAGVGRAVLAALAEIGLKLRVLHLDLLDAGARIGIVGKDLAVGEVRAVVEEGQHCRRIHALDRVVGDLGLLGDRVEVILVVALAAGHVRGVDAVEVVAERVDPVGVGHRDLTRGVGVAVIAADALDDVLLHVGPGVLIGLDALFVDHVGEVRGLAGPAVGQRVGTAGLLDVDDIIVMASCAAVAEGEAIGLIERGEHRVLLEIIDDLRALARHVPALVDLGVFFGPVGGVEHRDAGVRLDLGGDLLDLDDRAAEVGRIEPAALECVEDCGLDAVGRKRRAGNRVDLQALGVVDDLGQGQNRLGADALGLFILEDLDLVDVVVRRGDLDGDVGVAAHGRSCQRQGAGGHLAVGDAGLPPRSAGNGICDRDGDDEQAAQDGDQVVLSQLFP